MISPRDARKYIEFQNVDFGQNVTLPDIVDTCNCEEFFGTRCDENVHVTGPKQAPMLTDETLGKILLDI